MLPRWWCRDEEKKRKRGGGRENREGKKVTVRSEGTWEVEWVGGEVGRK